jgi:hypothetical protein
MTEYKDPLKVKAENELIYNGMTQKEEDELENRILHVLTLYPRLMPTMLHTGIGPHVSPLKWRPMLEKLIVEGKVIRESVQTISPLGQNRAVTMLRLPGTPSAQIPPQRRTPAPAPAPVPVGETPPAS